MPHDRTLRFDTTPGRGPLHLICLPGLVPDGPETYLRQLHLFRAHGTVAVATYPYQRFDLDGVLASIAARIRQAHASGAQPVLVGVSVGGGLCLELLRRTREAGQALPLHGLLLISPLTCNADLSPLLRRLLSPIEAAATSTARTLAIERGRAFFRQLALRSAGSLAVPAGWMALFRSLLPGARAEAEILARVERTLASLPVEGAFERVLALRQLRGVHEAGKLCQAPALVLWGSRERHTLDMDGPGTRLLCRPDLAERVLPDAEVQWVYGNDGGEVPHASLIKHAHAFNPHLKRFLTRLARRSATVAVA